MAFRRRSSSDGWSSAAVGFRRSSASPRGRCRIKKQQSTQQNHGNKAGKRLLANAGEAEEESEKMRCGILTPRENNRAEASQRSRGSESHVGARTCA